MGDTAINVLHLSTLDRQGGAARAAFRLHRALRDLGIRSQMAVQAKSTDDSSICAPETRVAKLKNDAIAIADRIPLALQRKRKATSFDLQWVGSCSLSAVSRMRPDVIHLHWVAGGFLRIESLRKLGRPLVWTLHDMWPFTGGCHNDEGCGRYRGHCGACPLLGSSREWDLSRWVLRRKSRAWRTIDFNLVAPSRWMMECAQSSSLFCDRPIAVIPNGIDTSIFKPLDQAWARSCLGIEQERRVILFGAANALQDSNKGVDILQRAIPAVARKLGPAIPQLVVFGCSEPAAPCPLGLETRYLGHFSDETSMVLAYSAADVLVVPSRQESFCQIAAEALACGVPVVAFDSTGLRDVVDHQVNGYLAHPHDATDLAEGILWILASSAPQEMAIRARQKVSDKFSLGSVARQHEALYRQVLSR